MKNEAARARALRLDAANRLIRHNNQHHVLKLPKKPQHTKSRRMVPPTEMHIEVKVAGA